MGWRFAYWLTGAVDDKGEGVSSGKKMKSFTSSVPVFEPSCRLNHFPVFQP